VVTFDLVGDTSGSRAADGAGFAAGGTNMSLRNRARRLQEKTGLSYQQALDRLRKLGKQPADLSKKTGWALEVCDRYLLDGHAPIDVIEVRQPTPDLIEVICEGLRVSCGARAVLLAMDNGRIRAHVGGADVDHAVFLRTVTGPPLRPKVKVNLPEVWELDGDLVLVMARVKPGAMLVVKFHKGETSLGVVRMRMNKAVGELEAVLSLEDASPGGTPGPTGTPGGSGGAPAEARVWKPRRRRGE
jgi:hypothetical protein